LNGVLAGLEDLRFGGHHGILPEPPIGCNCSEWKLERDVE
jgi:hypothetical protein